MADKIKVTLIQDPTGQVRRVRIGNEAFPVLLAAPIAGVGVMNCSITLTDVEVAFETETAETAPVA